ncbi:EF-Tu/IF-2/RF-3 family GTPase [Microbacterium aurantiacum]|uniref:EF-Tu/IF-2/RF-3 family GTPase n=1 Tax=Microbacterium aurantiacum TaxID=162393 RepID=UPI000C7F8197|nr:EF-Tu/IF-2/RF-3 family GTPase [Microbacterium aurantiacum]
MGWLFGKKRDPQDASEMLRHYNEAEAARLTAMREGVDVDATVFSPSQDASGGELAVEDVFTITGRGIVATGTVTSGTVRVDDDVVILRGGVEHAASRITAVELFRKRADEASVGVNAGLVLSGKVSIARGDVIRVVPSG